MTCKAKVTIVWASYLASSRPLVRHLESNLQATHREFVKTLHTSFVSCAVYLIIIPSLEAMNQIIFLDVSLPLSTTLLMVLNYAFPHCI